MQKTLSIIYPSKERRNFVRDLAQALAKKIANDEYQAELSAAEPKP